jgi:hypothetical protein
MNVVPRGHQLLDGSEFRTQSTGLSTSVSYALVPYPDDPQIIPA